MTKSTCICGVSVHTATFVIAIVVLICDIIIFCNHTYLLLIQEQQVGFTIYPQPTSTSTEQQVIQQVNKIFSASGHGLSIFYVILSVVASMLCILLIYGNRTRKPVFYLPFLGITLLDIGTSVLSILGFLILAFTAFANPSKFELSKEEALVFGYTLLLLAVILGVIYSLRFYFFVIIVNRSRKLLIEEQRAINAGDVTEPVS